MPPALTVYLTLLSSSAAQDVKKIIGDEALVGAVAPKARKEYNLDQMTCIDTDAGKVSDRPG